MTDYNQIAGQIRQSAAQLEHLFAEAFELTPEIIQGYMALDEALKAGWPLTPEQVRLEQLRAQRRAAHAAGAAHVLDMYERELGQMQVAAVLPALSPRALVNAAQAGYDGWYAATGGKVL